MVGTLAVGGALVATAVAVGAISIIGPSVRLSRSQLREFAPIVKKYAADISSELGFGAKESEK